MPGEAADPEIVDEGLVLRGIICGLEEQLEDVLEVFATWTYEKDSGTDVVEVEGTVELHLPVLRSLLW
jgi:hypothetical protein